MIPAAFDYVRASSLAQAIDLLRDDPDGTKLLAGGHTLLPALKLRLASPDLLIDIGGIAELSSLSTSFGVVTALTAVIALGAGALKSRAPICDTEDFS